MSFYQVVYKGKFSADMIELTYREGRIKQSREALQFIESKWQNAHNENAELFNGRLFRLDSHGMSENKLHLSLSDTDYKEYVGTRDTEFTRKFGNNFTSNPISVGIVLITSDNKVILGQRTSNVDIERLKIAVIAGYVDPSLDFIENKPDLFNAIRREVNEELLIDNDLISNIKSLGLVLNLRRNQTYMPFQGTVSLQADDVRDFNRKEFSQIVMLENDQKSVQDFISSMNNRLSDITLPTLEIYAELFESNG